MASIYLLAVLALPAHALAQNCDCATASLVGDTVGTLLNSNFAGPTNRVVGTGVELPNAGPILGSAGPAPRWNIDFGVNTIRVEFIGGPATYGTNSKFTFSSLDPKLPAGCTGTPFVSGITVTTNKASAPFVSTGATFGAHQVVVPFGPTSGNIDWYAGEFILVNLQFACDTPPVPPGDPCCPPWNSTKLQDMLVYQGTGGIAAPYTLKFQPTAAFNAQMQAYINYLKALNPAITSITINYALRNAGTGATAVPTGGPIGSGTLVWNANSTVVPTANFFSPGVMLVNRWYRIETTISLNGNIQFFPDKCVKNWVDVRIQVLPSPKAQPGATAGAAGTMQMRLPDGRVLSKPVQEAAQKE